MRDKIDSILQESVDLYGYCSVNDYKNKKKSLGKQKIEDDFSFLDGYKTIITIGVPYPSKPVKWKGKGYGLLSRYSYNTDYHIVLREVLRKIDLELDKLDIKHYSSVDVSRVDERLAGYLSQIGFIGHNQFLINNKFGSFMYLATILIDVNLTTNKYQLDSCGECTICIDACPSQALSDGFIKEKCISYLTQAKIEFDNEEIGYLKSMIYGCDICQNVCPKNKGIDVHKFAEFEPSGIENIKFEELLNFSNKDYKKIYGSNASSWKGATIIKRNALCLIANQNLVEFKDKIVESMADFKDVMWYNKTAEKVLKILNRE